MSTSNNVYQDDDLSGCEVVKTDNCNVCGDSLHVEDVGNVKSYKAGDLLRVVLVFNYENYKSLNQFRICPRDGKN